jgi:anti-anti-sigma factor
MEIQQFSHLTAINIHQPLDKQAAQNLSWLISTASQFATKNIVLNMTEVSHATITGLQHLFEDFKQYQGTNIQFSVMNPNHETASLLNMAGFWLIFEQHHDRDLTTLNQSLQMEASQPPSQ